MLKPRRWKKCWQPMASKVLEQSSKEFSAPKVAILSDIFGARVSHSSQPKHCFDSWESSNNRKYYFTSIKLREWEIIFLSLHGEETSLESRENNFVLSSFKYILPWTAEISQHFSLIYRGENIFYCRLHHLNAKFPSLSDSVSIELKFPLFFSSCSRAGGGRN